MEVRPAVSRIILLWMTAERDGFSLLVAAIRISAIADLQIDERKMTRIDFHAAQLWQFVSLEKRDPRDKFRDMALARLTQWYQFFSRTARGRTAWRIVALFGGKSPIRLARPIMALRE